MNRKREVKAAQNGFLDLTENNPSLTSTSDSSEVTSLIIKHLVSSELMQSDASYTGDKSDKIAWSKARASILWNMTFWTINRFSS